MDIDDGKIITRSPHRVGASLTNRMAKLDTKTELLEGYLVKGTGVPPLEKPLMKFEYIRNQTHPNGMKRESSVEYDNA